MLPSATVPPDRGWVEVNGVSVRYALRGRGSRTLVLVHEMGGSIESWDAVVALLENDFRILCYDQRGFGLSEKNTAMSLDAMTADLHALLEALALPTPVCLASAALGAAICLAFALRHPDKVSALVLSSPATGGMQAAARAKMAQRIELVRQGGMRAITDAMFDIAYPPALRSDHERFERHRLRWLTVDPESFIALNQMMLGFDLAPALPTLTCPVLVIGCRHDAIRAPERCRKLAARMPNGRFVEADSGHYMPLQSPAQFASLTRSFLLADAARNSRDDA